MKIKYSIDHIISGSPHTSWCAEQNRFIPAELRLYVTYYRDVDDAMTAIKKLRREFSGWSADLFLNSHIDYLDGNI